MELEIKATGWLTNSEAVGHELAHRCGEALMNYDRLDAGGAPGPPDHPGMVVSAGAYGYGRPSARTDLRSNGGTMLAEQRRMPELGDAIMVGMG